MIAVLDYGSGNVRAFLNAYERMKVPCYAARTPADLARAERIILPGVGAFDTAMQQFEASGMLPEVERLVVRGGMPLLGVCVGMQMLARSSEEGVRRGLGWIEGEVKKLRPPPGTATLKLPHMGWNRIETRPGSEVLGNLPNGGRFYFLHSYIFSCTDQAHELAWSNYGTRFTCAVSKGSIIGAQFHPEKSHDDGMTLLRNFSSLK